LSKRLKILSLSGGGTRGAFSAQVVAELEEAANSKSCDRFGLFTGTSVGGMIAVGLSLGIPAKELSEQIVEYSAEIFGRAALINPYGAFRTKHKPEMLKRSIIKIIGAKNARKAISELPAPVLIPAISLSSNQIVYFCAEPRIGSKLCLDAKVVDALMATTAAPTFLPPHWSLGHSFVDGGVGVNSPDVDGLYYARSAWLKPLDNISLLSVGTGYFPFEASERERSEFGGIYWLKNQKIVSRMISLQEGSASDLARDLLDERYCRVDLALPKEIELDTYNTSELNGLRNSAQGLMKAMLSETPNRISQFLL
jgi:patatin-like phospholipase/acyl hydrolase